MEYENVNLKDLFEKAQKNSLVLPDFQRKFVWNTEQQRLLLASFLVDLPIGNFLLLKGKKDEFSARPIGYQSSITPTTDCYYLLDGQQRLSTLYNIFNNTLENVSDTFSQDELNTRYDELYPNLRNRWYLNLDKEEMFEKLLEIIDTSNPSFYEPDDILDLFEFFSVPGATSKKNQDHYLNPRNTFGQSKLTRTSINREIVKYTTFHNTVPLFDFLSESKPIYSRSLKAVLKNKIEVYQEKAKEDQSIYEKYIPDFLIDRNEDELEDYWSELNDKWYESITSYLDDLLKARISLPVIPSNQLARATTIFEYMNKGGTALDTFDIMVAKLFKIKDEKTLNDYINEACNSKVAIKNYDNSVEKKEYNSQYAFLSNKDGILKEVKEFYLNLIALHCADPAKLTAETFKKNALYKLKREQVSEVIEQVNVTFVRTLAFIQLNCGVTRFSDFSYKLFLLPIASILKENKLFTNANIKKIEYWYWVSLFSGRFREKQNQRAVEDIELLNNFIKDKDNSIKARKEAMFTDKDYCDKDILLLKNSENTIPKAIHLGILQYKLSHFRQDLLNHSIYLYPWDIFENNIELHDHHIFPLFTHKNIKESAINIRKNKKNILNSSLNRIYVTKESNYKISSLSPSNYLEDVDISSLTFMSESVKDPKNNNEIESIINSNFEFFKSSVIQKVQQLLK